MKKTFLFILIFILPLFILTGCYDATSIESFEYCIAIGIDKSDSPDKISFSMQMIKPSASSEGSTGSKDSSGNSNSNIITVECSSINNGITIINSHSNNKVNLAHCTAIVFSEEIANEGIGDYISALSNNSQIRPTCSLIISSNTAMNFLETSAKSSEQFSSAQYEYIDLSSKTTGYTVQTTIYEYVSNTLESTSDSVIPYVEMHDGTVQPYGICVVKDDQLVGKLTPLESICHLIITNKLKQCTIEVPSPFTDQKHMNVKLYQKKQTNNIISINNQSPFIQINCVLEGEILNDSSFFNESSKESVDIVTSAVNTYLEKVISEYLYKTSQEFGADIADFARYIKVDYKTTEEWEHVNWNEIYSNAFFKVSLSTNLQPGYLFLKE